MKILYEDRDFLAIDKPSGISVHGDGKTKVKTLTDWVLKNYPKMAKVGEPMLIDGKEIDRPGIVHRLDKDTSGVLVLAKNQKAHAYLKEQFQNKEVKKIYHTVVNGWVKNDRGVLDKPIGRSPSDFRRRLAGRGARGAMREAITEYRVLKRFMGGKEKYTYVEVSPKTGRTHQIRVHMKYLNHPVVCDELYNPDKPCPKGFGRLALHSKSIEFKTPKGKTIKIESPLPKEFTAIAK
jgi:23S rRNA pseudouridine1911/1915/1917 synthase